MDISRATRLLKSFEEAAYKDDGPLLSRQLKILALSRSILIRVAIGNRLRNGSAARLTGKLGYPNTVRIVFQLEGERAELRYLAANKGTPPRAKTCEVTERRGGKQNQLVR